MVEATIDTSFVKYQETLILQATKSWRQRIQTVLDRFIHKDREEYLDQAHLPFKKRYAVVDKLRRLNDLSGYHAIFMRELEKLVETLPKHRRANPLRILDIGAGGGGLLERIYHWARARKIPVELTGIDSNSDFVIVTQFNLNAKRIPATMYRADACALSDIADDSFDVVISSYMVHHIRTPGKVAVFLSDVYRIAREGWLIADFDRRIYAPLLVGLVGFLLSGSRTLVSDGVKSARRAYRAAEVNFILEEVRKTKKVSGMDCVSYPVFPYWMIRGRKSGDSV